MSEETATPADQPDVSLSAASRDQLVEALVAAFGRKGLERLTQYKLDEKLEDIAGEGNLRETTFDLVEWAHARGRMRDLVSGARAENSGNAALRAFGEGVWARALAGDPSVLAERGRDAQRGRAVPPPRWYESPLVRQRLLILVALVIIGIAAIVLRPIVASFGPGVWLSVPPGSLPTVAFHLTANNHHGPIVVEGRLVDPETLETIDTASSPPPQTFELEPDSRRAEWSWQKLTFSPLPTPHCVAVQVVAYEGDGYPDNKVELAKATQHLGPSSEGFDC